MGRWTRAWIILKIRLLPQMGLEGMEWVVSLGRLIWIGAFVDHLGSHRLALMWSMNFMRCGALEVERKTHDEVWLLQVGLWPLGVMEGKRRFFKSYRLAMFLATHKALMLFQCPSTSFSSMTLPSEVVVFSCPGEHSFPISSSRFVPCSTSSFSKGDPLLWSW